VNLTVSVVVVASASASVTDSEACPAASVVTVAKATVFLLAPAVIAGYIRIPAIGYPHWSVTVAVITFVLAYLAFWLDV